MVHERLGPLVRSAHERDEHTLYLLDVALERVEEAARLQVLRRSAHGQPVVLDDVSKPGETGPKPNRIDQGIDTRIDVPSAIPEDLWKQRRTG